MYSYFHSHSPGFNSTLNVLLHFLLHSLSRPVGFTKIQSSRDRPFSQWRGRNSWSSISPGTYLCWMPINYPCSDFTESALSLYCWNRTWIAHEWQMLFNVWYPHPAPIYSEVESQWDGFWTRCYDSASLNLLKKWSMFICIFSPLLFLFPYSIAVFFQTRLRICNICNIKCFVLYNLNFSSIWTKVVIDTHLAWLILKIIIHL